VTIDQFTMNIKTRWEDADSEDLNFIAKELEGYKQEDYERIYSEFRRKYPYNTAPRVAHIVKAIESIGLKKDYSRADTSEYAYRCTDCGQLYAGRISWMDAPACPKCFSKNSQVVESPERKDVVTVQTMCLIGWGDYIGQHEEQRTISHCPIWSKELHSMGPLCDIFYFGSGEECRTCACRKCCISARKEREELQNWQKGTKDVHGLLKTAFGNRRVAE
jgi:hypothetical protein